MNGSTKRSFTAAQARLGTAFFALGFGVLGLAAWDNSLGLPFAMPRFWHIQRVACLAVSLVLGTAGLYVMSHGPREDSDLGQVSKWKPTRPGRRFHMLTFYMRDGCHLCDEALELLQRYSAYLPPIHEVDVDADSASRERFDTAVPVVEIDGKIRFRGRVSELLLRRLIEGTRPT